MIVEIRLRWIRDISQDYTIHIREIEEATFTETYPETNISARDYLDPTVIFSKRTYQYVDNKPIWCDVYYHDSDVLQNPEKIYDAPRITSAIKLYVALKKTVDTGIYTTITTL